MVVELETTRGGLIVIVKFVAVRVLAIGRGAGGLIEVFMAISCGFVRVICNWLYVFGATLAVLRIFVKSVKRANPRWPAPWSLPA